uniref:protein-serine/threonine phosphatase n=1 Tax=Periophthalmus magnuspinnatus TaxID=409849 RepID=A0A3B4AYN5_9GOBI
MALLTLHRAPSISTSPDDTLQRRGRLQKESFALVKGAVLLIEDEPREGDSSPPLTSPTKQNDTVSNARHRQLHAMVELLRPEDTIKLAVQLESVSPVRVRYLIIVSTLGNKDESILLGMDFPNADDQCTIGLVLPIWSDTQVYLDGDVASAVETRIFKPVSMQTMSVLQALHGCCERAVKASLIPGNGLEWAEHYQQHIESDRFCLNEWEAMDDLESVRKDSSGIHNVLNTRLGFDIRPFKEYIDNEILVTLAQMDKPSEIFDYLYLGSEWNAANLEELQKNVGYILNVTREIDNFFPASFTYMNIRVYDVEETDLLSHWLDTYNFINNAKSGQAVFVHCKMGISRSASTVIAYAMKQYQWPLDAALAYVKERRSIIKPNEGFMKQLHTYSGILIAQQRHSTLWRRKSRDQRQKSIAKGAKNEKQSQGEGDKEDEVDEDVDEDDVESGEEDDSSCSDDDNEEVFQDYGNSSKTSESTENETSDTNPAITVSEPGKVIPSVNRSGRMNLFSLMQSISELEDDQAGSEKSPGQRRRSNSRRGLTHQRECVDVSPEPRSLQDA